MVGNVSCALCIYGTKQRLYRLYTVQCSFYMSLQGGGGLARVEVGGSGRVPASRARLRSSTLGSEVRGGGPDSAGGWGVKYVGIFGGVKDFRVVENVKVEEEGGARRLGKVGAADDL